MRKISLVTVFLTLCFASLISCDGSRALAQPRPEVEVADDKVTFPERFSLAEFFDLVSQSMGTRIIAPGDDEEGLTNKLNTSLGNRRVSAKEAIEKYCDLHGLPYNRSLSLFIFEGPYLGSSEQGIKNAREEMEKKILTGDFVLSLSKDQISQMYADGYLITKMLTQQQKPLYAKLMRRYAFGSFPETISDEELLARFSKFRFSLTASFLVAPIGGERTSWLGMYSYGTGLIWNPLAPTVSNPALNDAQGEAAKPAQPLEFAVTLRGKPVVEFSKVHIWTLRQALDTIQERTGKKVVIDEDLSEETLRTTQVVLTKGAYSLEELMDGVSATIGSELRPSGSGFYLGQTGFQGQRRRRSSIRDKFNKVEQTLQRLPPPSAVIPFFSSTFEKQDELPYATLNAAQQTYIRARLLNEQDDEFTHVDLDTANIRFAKTLWFTQLSNGSVMSTTYYQVW